MDMFTRSWKRKKIQINCIEHHIWSDCVEYQILFFQGRLEKKKLHVCVTTVKNECYRLVLTKSLMMCSYFLFRLLALTFSIPVLACTTTDGRWSELHRSVRCQELQERSVNVYKSLHQINEADEKQFTLTRLRKSLTRHHSPSVASSTRQSDTRTQKLLGSITTTMKVRGNVKLRELSHTMRHKRKVSATATIRTRSTICVSRASGRLTKAGLLQSTQRSR